MLLELPARSLQWWRQVIEDGRKGILMSRTLRRRVWWVIAPCLLLMGRIVLTEIASTRRSRWSRDGRGEKEEVVRGSRLGA